MERRDKIANQLKKEEDAFYAKVTKTNRHDVKFSREDDEPLTEDEIRQIDEYWGKYKFAYPQIDYNSFKNYKNRYGKFDVRCVPSAIRNYYLKPHFLDNRFLFAFQHKALINKIYPDINHPDFVLGYASSIYMDKNGQGLTSEQAVDEIFNYLKKNRRVPGVIFKKNHSCGGHGVTLLKREDATREAISDKIKKSSTFSYVVQGYLKQSSFMSKFSKSSVNTIRITTLMHNGRSQVIAALVRAASTDTFVDNWSSGGLLVGINKDTGKLNNWALTNDLQHISILPSGLDLAKETLYIPNYHKIVEAVTHSHYRNPYTKMVSWDVALNSKNIPTLIECNFGGMIQIHQATTGPLFAELTDDVLDTYLLDKFYLTRVYDDFVVHEYHDHVNIKEYLGESKHVIIPDTLSDKPVRLLLSSTFTNKKEVEAVTISEKIKKRSSSAFTLIPTATINS